MTLSCDPNVLEMTRCISRERSCVPLSCRRHNWAAVMLAVVSHRHLPWHHLWCVHHSPEQPSSLAVNDMASVNWSRGTEESWLCESVTSLGPMWWHPSLCPIRGVAMICCVSIKNGEFPTVKVDCQRTGWIPTDNFLKTSFSSCEGFPNQGGLFPN